MLIFYFKVESPVLKIKVILVKSHQYQLQIKACLNTRISLILRQSGLQMQSCSKATSVTAVPRRAWPSETPAWREEEDGAVSAGP